MSIRIENRMWVNDLKMFVYLYELIWQCNVFRAGSLCPMDVNDVDSFDPIAIYQQLILQNGL